MAQGQIETALRSVLEGMGVEGANIQLERPKDPSQLIDPTRFIEALS